MKKEDWVGSFAGCYSLVNWPAQKWDMMCVWVRYRAFFNSVHALPSQLNLFLGFLTTIGRCFHRPNNGWQVS